MNVKATVLINERKEWKSISDIFIYFLLPSGLKLLLTFYMNQKSCALDCRTDCQANTGTLLNRNKNLELNCQRIAVRNKQF